MCFLEPSLFVKTATFGWKFPIFCRWPFLVFLRVHFKTPSYVYINIINYKFILNDKAGLNPKKEASSVQNPWTPFTNNKFGPENLCWPNPLQGVLLRMERLLSKYLSRFAASRSRAATFEDAAERRVKAMQRYLANHPTENWMEELKELSLSSWRLVFLGSVVLFF